MSTHRARSIAFTAAFAALSIGAAAAPPTPQKPLFGAYKDITIGIDAKTQRFGGAKPAAKVDVVAWSFAVGECGAESWSGQPADAVAAANVPAHVQAKQRYVLATGGAIGVFTCGNDEGMARFIARYDSPMLAGLDFDIEGRQTDEQIDDIVQRVKVAQRTRPRLVYSFTLATHAATDGSDRSLNATAERVLRAIRKHRLDGVVINLMVMNYGAAAPDICVVRSSDKRCDMGRSALQAARNVAKKYDLPLRHIAITAMPGVNDVAENVTTIADARLMAEQARAAGLAGVHYWSVDRDAPCAKSTSTAVATCHSLAGVRAGEFGRALSEGLGR